MSKSCWLCRKEGHAGGACPDYYEVRQYQVQSVVPAHPGTRAVLLVDGDSLELPLLLWATYKARDLRKRRPGGQVVIRYAWERAVCGMVESEYLQLCDEINEFKSYLAPGEILGPDWFTQRELEVPVRLRTPAWEREAVERAEALMKGS